MGIKGGTKITLCQDQEEPRNWYFFQDSQHGFEVRAGYDDRGCLFNHSGLVEAFIGAFQLDAEKSHPFLIGSEPTIMAGSKTKYWGILIPAQ